MKIQILDQSKTYRAKYWKRINLWFKRKRVSIIIAVYKRSKHHFLFPVLIKRKTIRLASPWHVIKFEFGITKHEQSN